MQLAGNTRNVRHSTCSQWFNRLIPVATLISLVASPLAADGHTFGTKGNGEVQDFLISTPAGTWVVQLPSDGNFSIGLIDDETGEVLGKQPLTPCPDGDDRECREPYQSSTLETRRLGDRSQEPIIFGTPYVLDPALEAAFAAAKESLRTSCPDLDTRVMGECPHPYVDNPADADSGSSIGELLK